MSRPGEETTAEDLDATGSEDPVSDHKEIIEETIDIDDEATEQDAESALSVDERLAAALDELSEGRDAVLRAEAEMQNVRRRAERDVENAHKYGIERFLQNLLPVVDSIEKSIESTDQDGQEENDPVIEGIRLTHKLLMDLLNKEQVEVVDPLGEPFDPNEHEAMSMVENPDMEPNSVFAVMQKGYKLNKRLVRPAMVMVSKAPA